MIQIWEYIKIALLNIKSNKGRSILTMLGIIIGISSVIMIISIGNGVKGGINNELNAMAGGQLYIYSYGDNEEGVQVEFTEDDIQAIMEKVPHVKAVTPSWTFGGCSFTGRKGTFNGNANMGMAGLEYSSSDPIIKGRYFTDNDYYSANCVCVLTESSAKLLFGTTDVIGMTIAMNMYGISKDFTIIGIRQDNASLLGGMMSEMVSIECPLTVVSSCYGFYVNMNDLLIISDGAEYSTEVAEKTVRLMENRHGVRGKNAIQVENFNDYMSQIGDILNYITIFVVFVAAISLLVGGIGVMNIMLVSVTERTREIGIRKALGARTRSILIQFLAESALISLLGGLIGIIIGVLGATAVCSLIGFKATISIGTVLGASAFSSAVGIFFGIYPARKAARLSPIEALRHE